MQAVRSQDATRHQQMWTIMSQLQETLISLEQYDTSEGMSNAETREWSSQP